MNQRRLASTPRARALMCGLLVGWGAAAGAQDEPPAARRDDAKIVRTTVRQLRDAWLSVDAAVVGRYVGVEIGRASCRERV